MIEYTVYECHLRLITRDLTEVDELVGGDTWRYDYLVTKRVVAGDS